MEVFMETVFRHQFMHLILKKIFGGHCLIISKARI